MVLTLTVGAFAANCHILPCPEKPLALVVDPGDEAERIADALRKHELRPAFYLLTHGHMDHVCALAALEKQWPAPVAMHPLDARWAFTEANAMPPYYDLPRAPSSIARTLSEGQDWNDCGLRYQVMETPGHSPGSVCFYFPDLELLFSGDVLFAGSAGRTDLPGSDAKQLMHSLSRLKSLPGNTKVFCGHGPPTTIARELLSNPYLRHR